jgi:hypothetical protein
MALHDQTDRSLGRADVNDSLGPRLMVELNVYAFVVETVMRLRRRGVELIGMVDDDSWHPTFRQLVSCSRVVVIDVSAKGAGLAYEIEYIRALSFRPAWCSFTTDPRRRLRWLTVSVVKASMFPSSPTAFGDWVV